MANGKLTSACDERSGLGDEIYPNAISSCKIKFRNVFPAALSGRLLRLEIARGSVP